MEGNISQKNITELNLASLVPEWTKIALTAFFGIAFVLGIPGNSFVIFLHVRLQRQSFTDWMVFYLAVCDVVYLVVCAPFFILLHFDVWTLFTPNWLCRLNYFVLFATCHTSGVVISCLAVYRFKATLAQTFVEKDASTKGKLMGLGITIICLLSVPQLFTVHNNANGYCVINYSNKSILITTFALSTVLSVTFCTVTCVFYTRVAIFFRRWRRVIPMNGLTVATTLSGNRVNSKKTTLLMSIVAIVYVCSTLLPMIAGLLVSGLRVRTTATFFLSRLFFLNNFANPILYFCLSPSFRTAVLNTILCRTNRPQLTGAREQHRNQINTPV